MDDKKGGGKERKIFLSVQSIVPSSDQPPSRTKLLYSLLYMLFATLQNRQTHRRTPHTEQVSLVIMSQLSGIREAKLQNVD